MATRRPSPKSNSLPYSSRKSRARLCGRVRRFEPVDERRGTPSQPDQARTTPATEHSSVMASAS